VPTNYKAKIFESIGPKVAATTRELYQQTAKNPSKMRIPISLKTIFFYNNIVKIETTIL